MPIRALYGNDPQAEDRCCVLSREYSDEPVPSLELELDTFMEKLYKKYVPSQTREYIESMAEPEEQPRPRPARSPRSAAPDTFDEKKGVE